MLVRVSNKLQKQTLNSPLYLFLITSNRLTLVHIGDLVLVSAPVISLLASNHLRLLDAITIRALIETSLSDIIPEVVHHVSCRTIPAHYVGTPSGGSFSHPQFYTLLPHHLGKVSCAGSPSGIVEIELANFFIPEGKMNKRRYLRTSLMNLPCVLILLD